MRIQNRVAHRRIEDLLAGIRSAPGRIAIAFVYRDFRLLWAGAFTSSIGTWMQKVAQAWLIVTMTGSRSAFYLGLDSFLAELPLLLFTVIGGVISDRHDRRYSILMSQITQMLVALTLALLVFTPFHSPWAASGRLAVLHISRFYPHSSIGNISRMRLHLTPFSSISPR